jgi:hypothetical protein
MTKRTVDFDLARLDGRVRIGPILNVRPIQTVQRPMALQAPQPCGGLKAASMVVGPMDG